VQDKQTDGQARPVMWPIRTVAQKIYERCELIAQSS